MVERTIKNSEFIEVLSKAQKRKLTTEIKNFVEDAIYTYCQDEIDKIAETWVKENKTWITQRISEHLEVALQRQIKRLSVYIHQ